MRVVSTLRFRFGEENRQRFINQSINNLVAANYNNLFTSASMTNAGSLIRSAVYGFRHFMCDN